MNRLFKTHASAPNHIQNVAISMAEAATQLSLVTKTIMLAPMTAAHVAIPRPICLLFIFWPNSMCIIPSGPGGTKNLRKDCIRLW